MVHKWNLYLAKANYTRGSADII